MESLTVYLFSLFLLVRLILFFSIFTRLTRCGILRKSFLELLEPPLALRESTFLSTEFFCLVEETNVPQKEMLDKYF